MTRTERVAELAAEWGVDENLAGAALSEALREQPDKSTLKQRAAAKIARLRRPLRCEPAPEPLSTATITDFATFKVWSASRRDSEFRRKVDDALLREEGEERVHTNIPLSLLRWIDESARHAGVTRETAIVAMMEAARAQYK